VALFLNALGMPRLRLLVSVAASGEARARAVGLVGDTLLTVAV
jgi:hypothetical protein